MENFPTHEKIMYARALSLQKRSIGIEKFCKPGKVPLTWKSSISVEMKYCISIVTFYGHEKFFQTQKSFISIQKFHMHEKFQQAWKGFMTMEKF